MWAPTQYNMLSGEATAHAQVHAQPDAPGETVSSAPVPLTPLRGILLLQSQCLSTYRHPYNAARDKSRCDTPAPKDTAQVGGLQSRKTARQSRLVIQ